MRGFAATALLLGGCGFGTVSGTDPGVVGSAAGGSAGAATNQGGAMNRGGTTGQGASTNHAGSTPVVSTVMDPGAPVAVDASELQGADEGRVRQALGELDGLTAATLAANYPATFAAAPAYEPASIAGLDKIQASTLQLNDAGLAALRSRGFAISQRVFPSFAYGYQTIYMEDLPLYVSADSILNAVHRSYDAILQSLEAGVLSRDLRQLLSGMQAGLPRHAASGVDAAALKDTDLFLAVARSLLEGQVVIPEAGADPTAVQRLFDKAQAGSGVETLELFGTRRENEDFSQFKPRGHYLDSPELERYFRTMMWLGRIDLRLLETQSDGTQLFRRRQLEIAVMLRDLVGGEFKQQFERIDRTLAAFVGEPDYMVLSQVDELLADLGISGAAQLASFSDEQLAQAVIDGDYGAQRISSHFMVNGTDVGTLPLSRSFAFLGQRYVIDSHVFSNVVYDRIGKRMLPDPLDVAFAALGNDQAASLLAPQLAAHEADNYPQALAKMRYLVDDHGAAYWGGSLYTAWLGALRQLSPGVTSLAADAQSLFPAARTEAWGRRLLNTQLASWAELRHDTILYAKQSYTAGAACEFPDAYVDPYPEFYAAIAAYGTRGSQLIESLGLSGDAASASSAISAHFALVTDVATRLQQMAEHERTGAEFTPEMMEFINQAVQISVSCDGHGELRAGWYKSLFFQPSSAAWWEPTIADVHTQPTDEAGNVVGKVLHVGTGSPNTLVVVAEGCSGPRAYVGLTSSYRETVESDFSRLDDVSWASRSYLEPAVPWFADLVSP